MKRISFLFFALAVAAGCSSSTSDDDAAPQSESSESDIKIGKKPKPKPAPTLTCAEVFGECVALTPWTCDGGTWADATVVTCGGGLGVGCCVKPTPPPPPPPPPADPCPTLSPPSPTFCTGGTITPITDASGCVRGYDCVQPTQNDCEKAGGECIGLTPSNCTGGTWADYATHSCGSGIGVGCCIR
jgi:hypothetical protein